MDRCLAAAVERHIVRQVPKINGRIDDGSHEKRGAAELINNVARC